MDPLWKACEVVRMCRCFCGKKARAVVRDRVARHMLGLVEELGRTRGRDSGVSAALVGVRRIDPSVGGNADFAVLNPEGHLERRHTIAGQPPTHDSAGHPDRDGQIELRPAQFLQANAQTFRCARR
jgi:hypothetical protein